MSYVNQNIDNIYERFEEQFYEYLEKSKEKLHEDLAKKLQPNEAKLQDLKAKFENLYSLKQLKQMIQDFNKSERTPSDQKEFEKSIQKFLTGKSTETQKKQLDQIYQEKKKAIKEVFKEELLHHNFDKITKQADEIPITVIPPASSTTYKI